MGIHASFYKKVKCLECNKYFSKPANLIQHCKVAHPTNDQVINESLKKKPKQFQKKNGPHLCAICGKCYERRASLKQHIKEVHLQQNQTKCPNCHKWFRNKAGANKHAEKYHTDRSRKNTPKETEAEINEIAQKVDDDVSCDGLIGFTEEFVPIYRGAEFIGRESLQVNIENHKSKENVIIIADDDIVSTDEVEQTEHLSLVEKINAFSSEGKNTHDKLSSENVVYGSKFSNIHTNYYSDSVKLIQSLDCTLCNCKPLDKCGDSCWNRCVYTECDPRTCPCGEQCENTVIQKHIVSPVESFMTQKKGMGLRAKELIKANTYILEYVGEVIEECEYMKRMDTIYKDDTHNYGVRLNRGQVIDSHRMGNDCRLINHSCDPNSELQKWTVFGLKRMAVFALQDIQAKEEITMDYNFIPYNIAEKCECTSHKCRGYIAHGVHSKERVELFNALQLVGKPRHQLQKNSTKSTEPGKLINAKSDVSLNRDRKTRSNQRKEATLKPSMKTRSQKIKVELLEKFNKQICLKSKTKNKLGKTAIKRISCSSKIRVQSIKSSVSQTESHTNSFKTGEVVGIDNNDETNQPDTGKVQYEETFIDNNDSKRFITVFFNASAAASTASSTDMIKPIEEQEVILPNNKKITLKLDEEMELYSQGINSDAQMFNNKRQNSMTQPLSFNSTKQSLHTPINHGHLRRHPHELSFNFLNT